MAGESIAASKITDKSIGSAGVRMVKSISILDTSEFKYFIVQIDKYKFTGLYHHVY
jgi:hypothetical protein